MSQPVVKIIPAEPNEELARSLAELCGESLRLYQQLLLEYNYVRDSDGHVSQERLLAEYGRFKIWIEQTGAILEERGSLEDILQQDPALRDNVADILLQLNAQLSVGMFQSRGCLHGLAARDQLRFANENQHSHLRLPAAAKRCHPRMTREAIIPRTASTPEPAIGRWPASAPAKDIKANPAAALRL